MRYFIEQSNRFVYINKSIFDDWLSLRILDDNMEGVADMACCWILVF